jgi:hypothetical protein
MDNEHAVIIYFYYGKDSLSELHQLENKLRAIIDDAGIGEYDGHEINLDYTDVILYMYGQNAEVIFKTIRPVLIETDFMKTAKAILRFGPPEDDVPEIELSVYDNEKI